MASLMSEFRIAKRQRLREREQFVARAKQEQSLRIAELTEIFVQSQQKILATEQARQVAALEDQAQRQQELQELKSQIHTQIQQFEQERLEDAQIASTHRVNEVIARNISVRLQLEEIKGDRLITAFEDRQQRAQTESDRLDIAAIETQQRLQDIQIRATGVKIQLIQHKQERNYLAEIDRTQRAEERQTRADAVQVQLEVIKLDRAVMAEQLTQALASYREQLKESVWGGIADDFDRTDEQINEIIDRSKSIGSTKVELASKVTIEPSTSDTLSDSSTNSSTDFSSQPPSLKEPRKPKAKLIVKDSEPEIVPAKTTSPSSYDKTKEFIQSYVSQLEGNPTLLEVVNDRDTVRDLLAQGANLLHLDPSEILNSLLKMVEHP